MRQVRPAVTGVAATAALLLGALGAAPGAVAHPVGGERSTPVPILTPEGQLSAYVVNARRGPRARLPRVRRAIHRAEGEVVAAWPQVGVFVVHSTSAGFRTDLRTDRRARIASVGATRTTAVTEDTPGTAPAATTGGGGLLHSEFGNSRALEVDPREAEQWDMRLIKADRAHEITDGSSGVLVGVLDSGIDPDHPDLAPNLDTESSVNCSDGGRLDTSATGWQPTASDHGTHVAGTIAAARNGVGIVGVAPAARLASVKVVNDDGYIYPEYAICGFMWAGRQRMDVTNNSYFVDPFSYWCGDRPDQAAAMRAVDRAVRWSTTRGVVHAAAAGNSATDLATNTTDTSSPNDSAAVARTINDGCLDIPAELPGVVTVSSFARISSASLDTYLSSFSNRGLGVIDVAAPGSAILSTIVEGNGYGLKSGTSMASPHAAGVLALLVGRHPQWSPRRLRAALESQADDQACAAPQSDRGAACVGTPDDNSHAGEGMADALAAVGP